MPYNIPVAFPAESGFVPPAAGGAVAVKYAPITYAWTTGTLFYLPKGAVVVDAMVRITTLFNAAGNDLLEFGLATDADAFTDALTLAATGTLRYGITNFIGAGLLTTPLTARTAVTATYTQTSTAATTGAAILSLSYIIV